MLKEILKIIGVGIIIYPIGLIVAQLQGGLQSYDWVAILIIDIIVCTALILHEIYGNKPKK